MKKVLSNILFILIISITVIFIIYKINISNFCEAPLGVCIFKVSSNSMFPHFCVGDFVIIKKQTDYEVGDIITYKDKYNCLITHRIMEKYKNDLFITKGDANNICDEEQVHKKDVYGKVIHIIENIFKEEINETKKEGKNNNYFISNTYSAFYNNNIC